MESYSCAEDLFLKARKPYTITKQRERWTEEEHNRFLEALKLHGRAWQRIEEHIGTKTAVQIRSHAQKFFSKLEKEAVVKGVSLGQTLEIEIPPPRPKRKPSYPYPRKSYGASSITSSVEVTDGKLLTLASSLYPGSEISESKNDQSSQNPGGTENSAREKETLDEGNCLEDNLFQEASCVSVRSASQSSISTSMALQKTCTFREFVPSRKDIIESKDHIGKGDYPKLGTKDIQKSDRTEANLSHVDINGTGEMLSLKDSCHSSQDKLVRGNNTDKLKKPENVGQLSTAADEIQANHSYPRHVPVHIVDMSSGACVQPQPPGVYPTPNICHLGAHGNPYIFPNLTVSAATQPNSNITSRSSLHHQTLPNFPPPFAPLHNQETQKSAENISSAFGGLLMSALLQNPAAHMAASLAASFWPTPNGETSLDSSAGPLGGFPTKQMSATPNLAAIAAATVAAASAWWAAHGMLPLCPPMHTGFSYPQPQPTTATPMDITHAPLVGNNERQDNSTNNSPWEAEQIDPEVSEATKPQNRTSKWQTLSSSDSAESGGDSQSNCNKPKSAGEEQNPDTTAELVHDSNKLKMRKKVDRSSCGSNTASSTEVETDALEQDEEEPEQDQKDREESKEADSNHQVGEHNRRSRSSTSNTNGNTSANTNGSTSTNTNTNTNESWKEVSEEGRIAFQALFTRQVLPQSFSPPPDPKIIVQQQQQQQQPAENIVMEGLKQISDVKDDDEQMLQLNLSSSNSWGVNPEHSSLLGNNDTESSFLSMGLGHGKFKARRTGFKPYKRCSVEAKESRITGGSGQCCEEKGPKRIRLEGDASTL